MTALIGGSILAHLVLWFVLEPFGETTMGYDREAATEQIKNVQQREAARREREKEAREKIRLTDEQAEVLKQRLDRDKAKRIEKDIEEMQAARKELEERRDRVFEELRKRRIEQIARLDLHEIQRHVDELREQDRKLRRVKKKDDDSAKATREAIAEVRQLTERLAEQPGQAKEITKDLSEKLTEAKKKLDQEKKEASGERGKRQRELAKAAQDAADQAKDAVDELAKKISDVPAFNDTSTAKSLNEGSDEKPGSESSTPKEPQPDPAEPASDAQTAKNASQDAKDPAEGSDSQEPKAADASSPTDGSSKPQSAQQSQSDQQSGQGKPSSDSSTASKGRSLQEAYENAKRLEEQVREVYADVKAAELAISQNTSFTNAQKQVGPVVTPDRPDLSSELGEGNPGTVGELNDYREALDQVEGQTSDMANRSQSLAMQASGQQVGSQIQRALMSQNAGAGGGGVVDMTGYTTGDGGSEGLDEGVDGAHRSAGGDVQESVKFNAKKIVREALPGRMFTDASKRQGWLYLDTWYVIGPWENEGEPKFDVIHPPEVSVDLDAEYFDGKYADRKKHPDRVLRWHFVQSDEVRVQPHRTFGAATYYAYTEVYFDQPRDMLLAFGADAAGRCWVNGDLIWQDDIRSYWGLGEGYRKVRFHKGYNRVLVRIMNGSGECAWSVLVCPIEAVTVEP